MADIPEPTPFTSQVTGEAFPTYGNLDAVVQ